MDSGGVWLLMPSATKGSPAHLDHWNGGSWTRQTVPAKAGGSGQPLFAVSDLAYDGAAGVWAGPPRPTGRAGAGSARSRSGPTWASRRSSGEPAASGPTAQDDVPGDAGLYWPIAGDLLRSWLVWLRRVRLRRRLPGLRVSRALGCLALVALRRRHL